MPLEVWRPLASVTTKKVSQEILDEIIGRAVGTAQPERIVLSRVHSAEQLSRILSPAESHCTLKVHAPIICL
jgi:hypothetical protein